MQPCVYFKQHPSSTGTTFLATASARETSSCLLFWLNSSTSTFSQITIFWICRIQLLPQGCGGSLAESLLHLILRVCWNQCQFNHLLLGLILSRFGCIILMLVLPANFLLHRHFLHAHFSGFFTCHAKMQTKGKSSTSSPTFHSLLLLGRTCLVILHWRGRGNFHVLFSRDWKSVFMKWNLL